MQMAEFVQQNQTTRDTVRHYIDSNLLTPHKKGSRYDFTDQDSEDFEEIQALKKLGFSIKLIKQIKETHNTNCGSSYQWESNLALVEAEIALSKNELETLTEKLHFLEIVKKQLQLKMESSANQSDEFKE